MNTFRQLEQLNWNMMKSFADGLTAAVYRFSPGNQNEREIPVRILLATPTPEGFGFEDFRLYKTSRIFEIAVSELIGIMPKEGDRIEIGETHYIVKKTQSGPCYIHVGAYNISIQIHAQEF
jgi:hypothetical protein